MVLHSTIDRGRELLEKAHAGGITLQLVDGKVRMRRPDPAPADLLEELRAERETVVAALELGWPTDEENLARDEAGFAYVDHAIGNCCVCGEPCRSWDPEDHPRHPTCKLNEAAA